MVNGSCVGVTTAANTMVRKKIHRRLRASTAWLSTPTRLSATMTSGSSKLTPKAMSTDSTKPM